MRSQPFIDHTSQSSINKFPKNDKADVLSNKSSNAKIKQVPRNDNVPDLTLKEFLKELNLISEMIPNESPITKLSALVSCIKIRDLPNVNGGFRIHLSTAKSKASFTKRMHNICNGMIIDYPSCEVLVLPPQMPTLKHKASDLISKLDLYDI